MHIDLSQLEEGTTDLDFVDSPESYTAKDPALRLVQPVVVHISFTKTGNHIIVSGEAATKVQSNCSRCLDPFEYSMQTQFTTELRPKPVKVAETAAGSKKSKSQKEELEEIELEAEVAGETEVTYYTSELFDLSEETRQYLELAMPMQPLCKEDCSGLCPRCGANLNKGKCGCSPAELENPFAVLKQRLKNNR
ncbi:MAG: DUF177 domain-containing protein [bacterium]|nr:DUF177 domain-containing protein [bacterium]